MQTAARRTSVQRDNFRDAPLPLATAACIYDHRRGPRRLEIPTTAGSMTREAALLLFSSVRANVSMFPRIAQLRLQRQFPGDIDKARKLRVKRKYNVGTPGSPTPPICMS
jgi:hypothetical protein